MVGFDQTNLPADVTVDPSTAAVCINDGKARGGACIDNYQRFNARAQKLLCVTCYVTPLQFLGPAVTPPVVRPVLAAYTVGEADVSVMICVQASNVVDDIAVSYSTQNDQAIGKYFLMFDVIMILNETLMH